MSAYIITTAAGDFYTTGTCADVREILKAAQAGPLPEESMPESCQKSPQEENMRRFTIYTDSNMAGIDSRGAYTTLAEARMRLEKELDEDETSRGGYIFDELRQKVTAIYNGFNLEKIPEPYRGTPNEYTTKKERAMLESIMNKYSSEPTPATSPEANQDTTTGAQDGPTTAETTAANETPTTAETATEGPETSTATQDTTGSDTRPPRAQEANQEPGKAAGDHTGPAADHITGPGTAAGDYTGPTTGNTSGAAAEAITGRTTTPPQNPGHACENAPGRTERATAEQVHTPHAKRPPRAPQRAATHGRPRGHPEKTANFGRFYPLLDFPRTIFANLQGIPISVCIFGPKIFEKFQGKKSPCRGG
jgi:hypothetical protein